MPQRVCVTTAVALSVPSPPIARSNAIGWVAPASVRSPSTAIRLPSAAGCARVERNTMSRRLSTSSSIVWWMFALSSSPRACIPPVPSLHAERGGVGGEFDARLRRGPRRSRASPAMRSHGSGGRVRPSPRPRPCACAPRASRRRVRIGGCPVRSRRVEHILGRSQRHDRRPDGNRAGAHLLDGEADRRELRGDHGPRARRAGRRGREGARDDGADLGQGRDRDADGGDVDEADRHRRGRRAGRRGPSRRRARQVQGGRWPGPRQRGRHLPARRRRRHDPHQGADHGQGGVDGRGRRRRRARWR